ncbi:MULTISPECIES: hypothetical protein [Streptomyces]|uniref:hypothetical protein n=1 Tax=Streptomyces TaxID=1883 RepID=UPI00345C255B
MYGRTWTYAFYDGEDLVQSIDLDGTDTAQKLRRELEASGTWVTRIEFRRLSGEWGLAWREDQAEDRAA